MKQNNNKCDSINYLENKEIEKLKKDFEKLNSNERKLLVYKEIIKLVDGNIGLNKNDCNEDDGISNELTNIIMASGSKHIIIDVILAVYLYNKYDISKYWKQFYHKSLTSYNKILINYKKLAEELKISKSLELSHLFTYMLWNGYFSVTKHHAYMKKTQLMLPDLFSLTVVKGKGMCLEYAELLQNFLNCCGKNASLLLCKMPFDKSKIIGGYKPKIIRNVDRNKNDKRIVIGGFKNIEKQLKSIIIGNHAITLIEDDNHIYAYDPTNLFILNIKDKHTLSIVNGKGNFQMKLLPTLLYSSNSAYNNLFESLSNYNMQPIYSEEDIKISYEKVFELINENINLLDSAYDNNVSELRFINEQIKNYGILSKKI